MKNLKNFILDDVPCKYDEELLKQEFDVLKCNLNNKDLLLKKKEEYREKHLYLSENFTKEFKILNEQHYRMMKAIKSVKFNIDNDKSKELVITSENEVLKNIKNTFQTIINKKEKTLDTYKLLEEIASEYFYTKEDLVV